MNAHAHATVSTLTAAPAGLARPALIGTWLLQVAAAVILAQTLFFKFSGAEEAKFIFTTLGVEPWGRLGAGVVELITAVLLLIPRTAILGAGLALATMLGALGAHLGPLGIEVKDDGGTLFILGLIVFAASAGILAIRRGQIRQLVARPVCYLRGRE